MCLMKIRLGLLKEDLASRLNVSVTLCSRIFEAWVKRIARVLKPVVYAPEIDNIIDSRPRKFEKIGQTTQHRRCYRNFHSDTKKSQSATHGLVKL